MPKILPGWQEPPEDARQRDVTSDEDLLPEEKETNMTFPNDLDRGVIYTEVPTTIKWVLSIEESDLERVRINDEGEIIGCRAKIPKGIIKLQGSARKSDSHSQMVSYGDMR